MPHSLCFQLRDPPSTPTLFFFKCNTIFNPGMFSVSGCGKEDDSRQGTSSQYQNSFLDLAVWYWYSVFVNSIRISANTETAMLSSFSTSPTAGEGRGGEGCSFPAAPKIRCWPKPKPTIPLHRTGNLNHLSLWHHPLSSKNVLSISSSILSTTRCGELYYCHNGEIQGKVFCIAVNLFDGERIQSPQSIALIALLNWAQNIYLNQHMCVHQYISLESSTAHQYSLRKYFWGFFINQKLASTCGQKIWARWLNLVWLNGYSRKVRFWVECFAREKHFGHSRAGRLQSRSLKLDLLRGREEGTHV